MKREEIQTVLELVDATAAYWGALSGGAATAQFIPLEKARMDEAKVKLLAFVEDEDDGSYEAFTDLLPTSPPPQEGAPWIENGAMRELERAGHIERVPFRVDSGDWAGAVGDGPISYDLETRDPVPITEYFTEPTGTLDDIARASYPSVTDQVFGDSPLLRYLEREPASGPQPATERTSNADGTWIYGEI